MANLTPQPLGMITTTRQLSAIRFSRCGKLLAAAGRDATLRCWNVASLETPGSIEPANPQEAKGAKPNAQAKVQLQLPELPAALGHNGWITSLAFHPHEDFLFSADSWGQLSAWRYTEEKLAQVWTIPAAHEGWVRQLALSPDGTTLATCGLDCMIRLWSTSDGKKQGELHGEEDIFSLAYHPAGKSLVSGDLRGVVKQWDLATHSIARKFEAALLYLLSFIQDVGGVRALAFDAAGKVLAATGTQPTGGGFVQGTPIVRFFDWETGQETQTLKWGDATEGFVHELAFHPLGCWIGVTSGQPGKGKCFLHNPGEAQPYFSTPGLANCHSLAIHPSGGKLAVIANDGTFGQKKSQAREGIYPGNSSPIHFFALE